MTDRSITAWAIKAPSGKVLIPSIRTTKRDCIADEEFEQGYVWRNLNDYGYRCVRVQITEVPE